jgi:hypothetical protein
MNASVSQPSSLLVEHNVSSSDDVESSFNSAALVPYRLWQTHSSRTAVPQHIFDAVSRFAGPRYDYQFLDDDAAWNFLEAHFVQDVLNRFRELKRGSHKADLLRYCLLFIHGGVYLDIDTVLVAPLEEVFHHKPSLSTSGAVSAHESGRLVSTSVLSTKKGHVFQAVLAVPPRHPLVLRLIEHAVRTPLATANCDSKRVCKTRGKQHSNSCHQQQCTSVFTKYFYEELWRHLGREPVPGANEATQTTHMAPEPTGLREGGRSERREQQPVGWELFHEECDHGNGTLCGGRLDRYGHCCVVRRSLEEDRIVFLSRHPDFGSAAFKSPG